MNLRKKIPIKYLSGYSWTIIIAFIGASFSMQYQTNSYFDGVFSVLPLILATIYWCEKSTYLVGLNERNLKNKEIFKRDLFLLSFSFLLGFLIFLCLAYDNSDAKGWWVLATCVMIIYALIFSFVFSLLSLLIKNHKIYTLSFSFLIIVLLSFGKFLPQYITLPLIGNTDTFYLITCLLLVVHCLFASGLKIIMICLNKG